MTKLFQVCGGSISFIFGANLWSSNTFFGDSVVSAGSTIVSGFLAIFRNFSVSGRRASTSTSSGTRKFCFSVSHDVPNVSLHIFLLTVAIRCYRQLWAGRVFEFHRTLLIWFCSQAPFLICHRYLEEAWPSL